MALQVFDEQKTLGLTVSLGVLILLASTIIHLFQRPALPKNAPPLTLESFPILGSYKFFTERLAFTQRSSLRSPTGNFTFYAGQWPVVGLAGQASRKIFFEHKGLGFAEGYSTLLGGNPEVKPDDSNHKETFSQYFMKRLIAALKPNRLAEHLPQLCEDARGLMGDLAKDEKQQNQIDPYEVIYQMVFKLTMRVVAANEIADDQNMRQKVLRYFEAVERTGTTVSISFPWIMTPARIKRFYYGAKLYALVKQVIDKRQQDERRENDTLDILRDQGDSVRKVITFILAALFAGQLNTGVNAAWVLVYLAQDSEWKAKVEQEVRSVASRYSALESLKDQLMEIPYGAWETEFPVLDLCLREAIRLHSNGTAFRKNISGADIALNDSEVIPKDAYVALATGDFHYDPSIYQDPDRWDPARLLPDRAEDKRQLYGYVGWGVARHPCIGVRLAKLEVFMIVAFFMGYFEDVEMVDRQGRPTDRLPKLDKNDYTACRPDERVYLKYRVRPEAEKA